MPKTRIQKEAILATTTDRLQRSASVIFVSVQGVKVEQMEAIRDALFPAGVQLQVAKNNIFKLALEQIKVEVPSEILDQPVGMVFGYDDPVAAAKLMAPFVKEFEALNMVGGIMDGAFMTASQAKALSSLPSREQLYGRLVGTLAAPLSGLVNVLQGNLRGLVTVLSKIQPSQ